MPRFTYAPSGMSWATRSASSFLFSGDIGPLLQLETTTDRDDAIDEDAGGHDGLGIETPGSHELVDLHDCRGRGRGHDGPEVTGRLAVHQVAEPIGPVGADQREVCDDRVLEHVVATVD